MNTSPHALPIAATREAEARTPRAQREPCQSAITLADIPLGQPCLLAGLNAEGRLGQRLADMGFCPGLRATVVRRAPLGDPLEIDVAGSHVCIRRAEAAQVDVLLLAPDEDTWRTAPAARP